MNNNQSFPNFEGFQGAPMSAPPLGNYSPAASELMSILREQVIVLKRINSKLWKIHEILKTEEPIVSSEEGQ